MMGNCTLRQPCRHAVCSILRFARSLIARSTVSTIYVAVAALQFLPQCVRIAADVIQNVAHYVRQVLHPCQYGPLMRSTLNQSGVAVSCIAHICLV